jgi:RHS repeat-associated protein
MTAENEGLANVTLPPGEITNGNVSTLAQQGTAWRQYDLDKLGNVVQRRMRTQTLIETVDKLSRLTAWGGHAVSHDAIDDLTGKQGDPVATPFAFDLFKGTLTSATTAAGKTIFEYDALSRRRVEHRPDHTDHVYVWDGATLVAHGTASSLTLDVPGDDVDAHVVSIDQFGSGSKWFYHQGPDQSVLAVSGSAGLAEAYLYSAFGELTITNAQGATQSKSAFGNVFQYQGQLFDAATATYSMRAREYKPEWGRFLSPDPLGMRAEPSLYAFAGGRPLQSRDPSGMVSCDINLGRCDLDDSEAAAAGIIGGIPSLGNGGGASISEGVGDGVAWKDPTTGEIHVTEFWGVRDSTNDKWGDGSWNNFSDDGKEQVYVDRVVNVSAPFYHNWGGPSGGSRWDGGKKEDKGGGHTIERVAKEVSKRAKTYVKTIAPVVAGGVIALGGAGLLLGGGLYALGQAAGGLFGSRGVTPPILPGGGGTGTDDKPLYGPFTHQINKGKVGVIAETQQMISTLGRGGDEAVRASTGKFGLAAALEDGGKVIIEFYTSVMPSYIQPNGQASWYMEEGNYLPIILTAISYPAW